MTLPADIWPEAGPSTPRSDVGRVSRRMSDKASTRTPDTWNVARKYAIIVDAGSSGSRMQVYSWKEPRVDRAQRERQGEKVKVLPTVEKGTRDDSGQDWQLKVEPGLSSFGSHPQDVDAYLKPLFEHARTVIPADALADTPVYVLATAGMRLLPDVQRTAVLQRTCAYIETQSPFRFGEGGCAEHVQVISGEEEGLLGWIAINYLMDGFHFKSSQEGKDSKGGDVDGTVGKSTFGFLDMGGASTQIAFEPSSNAQDARPETHDDLTAVTLRMLDGTEVSHNVFVTTFLGFGTNRARDRYVEALLGFSGSVNGANAPSTIQDPCLPKGLTQTSQDHPSILGTGSFEQCLKSLAPLLDKDATCTRPPCLFHGVHVPSIDFSVNHFIGVSEYWFSSNDVFQLGGVYDYVSFQKAAQSFCGQSWEQLSSQLSTGTTYGKQVTKDRLEMQCFKAAWMATVLHEGIGLPRLTDPGGEGEGRVHADDAQHKADAKNLFQSVNDVGGLAVSWTLGKAVLEASRDIPSAVSGTSPSSTSAQAIDFVPNGSSSHGSSWQDKFSSSSWQRPSQSLLSAQNRTYSGLAVLAVVVLSIMACLSCAFLRGRSPKAIKRRAMLRDFMKSPCSRRQTSHGEYTLANMEEGGGNGHGNGHHDPADGSGIPLGSDTSGDEGKSLSLKGKHKRRRSSGNGILTAVLVPIQRIGLALGFKRPITPPSLPPISLGPRRHLPPRYPMRHQNVGAPISMSQPTSPKAYSAHIANSVAAAAAAGSSLSRPASRQGSVLSPRVLPHFNSAAALAANGPSDAPNSYFSAWQQQHNTSGTAPSSSFGSTTATATASARSSRAPSPVLGHPTNGHHLHHGYNNHHGSAISNGRLNPASRSASASGFSRKAWEDSD